MSLPSLAQREAFFAEELTRRGFSAPQQAAILGSMMQESSLNPYAQEAGGTGLGLFQWSYGRRKQVPSATGDFYRDARSQLDLFERELAGPESKAGSMLKGAQNLEQAGAAMKQFERYGTAGNRYKYMSDYLAKLQGGTLKGGSTEAATASSPAATQLAGDSLVGAMAQDPGAAAVVNQVATTGFNPFAIGAAALAPAANSEQTRFAGAAIEAIFGGGKKGGSIETGDLVTGLPQEALPSVAAAAGANEQRPSGAGGTLGLVPLGKQLQALGFKVAEHPEFGGVGKHSPRSHHYAGNALDITIQPGSPLLKGRPDSDWLAVKKQWGEKLRQALPGAEIFHPGYDPVGGHGSHIHLALPGGSTVVTEQLQRLLALTQG